MPDMGLAKLAADLRKAGEKAERDSRAVVKRGAFEIKKQWKRNYEASEMYFKAPHYTKTITYDILVGAGVTHAEIGPDKGLKQGALGNLIEFGSLNNDPQNDGGRALNAETPAFEREMSKLGDML